MASRTLPSGTSSLAAPLNPRLKGGVVQGEWGRVEVDQKSVT